MSKNLLHNYVEGLLSPQEQLEALVPENPDTSTLLVACSPQEYSASAFAKAVEDCDIQLIGLAVTAMRHPDGRPVVALRIGARSTLAVERSLARYGYEVLSTRSATRELEQIRAMERANELLHYLEM